MEQLQNKKRYNSLIEDIGILLQEGRNQAFQAVNTILVKTYWEIGKNIVDYDENAIFSMQKIPCIFKHEQEGKEKAEYGTALLDKLSNDLKSKYGKGFNIRNIYLMRKFYLAFPNLQTVSAKLSWSH